jgi:hypothetical protein
MAIAAPHSIEYGEVFTRRWVVETILDLVGYEPDEDLASTTMVEPSVGSGVFLEAIVERLTTSASKHGVPFSALSRSIRGYDLQRVHVEASRRVAIKVLVEAGCDRHVADLLAETWVRQADFLINDVDIEADFVVGNPPYIRFDDLDDEVVKAYRTRWRTMAGRVDIYIGFYERGLQMLKTGGRLGFICADRWMRNAYGARLRSLIGDKYAVKTLWQMHDVDAFEAEVSAYPAITILANETQGAVTVLDTTSDFGRTGALEATAFVRSGTAQGGGTGWSGGRLPSWFEGPDFWPAGGPKQIALLEHLQENFLALEDTGGDTKISIGVATGADKAFIVGPDADVEEDRLTPLVMADDIRKGRLEIPRRVLINPWDEQGKLVDIANYPRMEKALASHDAVRKRFIATRNPINWYRTIDKVYPGVAARPKLLLQDMKAQITPVFEPGGLYPHHNLYYITSSGWDLEVLGGLLLSRIAETFISAYGVKMRGGTLRFQAQYLRKIRVPSPEAIPVDVADQLRSAFRTYDRDQATRAAERAYGLPAGTS